ncbi:MAG: 50S ribosomal protein L17 [Nannocystis sp.]|nr:50S ribosomal protein L17 [Nannocystis sp.]MBA3547703.1 50S ribosomal protein L17 [Nannocystis sp.]
MRHQNSGRKFSRSSSHRKAMFRNMVTSLIEHERITTTEPKAKELRRFVEKTISISLRLGDILQKPKDQRSPAEQGKYIHALRMASRMIRTREVLHKLFDEVAPKLAGRPGGYTRILKVGQRVGDAAPMAIIELVSAASPGAVKAASAASTGTATSAGSDSAD